ncbi:hypothetical protein ACFVVM_03760 [Nocardia sp. NPDC058176]|uniref:hypothetical protein n=1 Tax=Nocardia sp. NPDC058176 TaxID=3346368 RepID=UPI0036DEE884
MSYNNIHPVTIGVSAGVLAFAALVALVEYDPVNPIADRLAQCKLTPAERAELARIQHEDREKSREFKARQARRAAERAETDAADLAGFDPDLLTTPGLVATAAGLTVSELAAEIVAAERTERTEREAPTGSLQQVIARRAHHRALDCEWHRRDAFEARLKLSRSEALRHRIAAEKVQAARSAPYLPLPTVFPFVEN